MYVTKKKKRRRRERRRGWEETEREIAWPSDISL